MDSYQRSIGMLIGQLSCNYNYCFEYIYIGLAKIVLFEKSPTIV